mgnify:CR=1 FL=1
MQFTNMEVGLLQLVKKIFILRIVKVLDEIDPDYNYKIAKRYYQMAKDAYGAG